MRIKFAVYVSVLVMWFSHHVFGQALFGFSNRYSGVDAPIYDDEGHLLDGTGYFAELWGGAEPHAITPVVDEYDWLSRDIEPFETGDYAGYFRGHGVIVLDVPNGGSAWLQVRAWDASLGSTYEEVAALGIGGYGESPMFYAQGSDPTTALPEVPAPLIGLQSFSLRAIVPEPTAGALLALGSGMLWRVRRHTVHR